MVGESDIGKTMGLLINAANNGIAEYTLFSDVLKALKATVGSIKAVMDKVPTPVKYNDSLKLVLLDAHKLAKKCSEIDQSNAVAVAEHIEELAKINGELMEAFSFWSDCVTTETLYTMKKLELEKEQLEKLLLENGIPLPVDFTIEATQPSKVSEGEGTSCLRQ